MGGQQDMSKARTLSEEMAKAIIELDDYREQNFVIENIKAVVKGHRQKVQQECEEKLERAQTINESMS